MTDVLYRELVPLNHRRRLEALDEAGPPDDDRFREAVRTHVEFGARVAEQNSWAETDADLHPIRAVPRWQWPTAAA